ncbi:hypothetical protein [Hamadaea tsunoensis]|uniref:hypothetical protein n=1 Tax=Hamadaea tsunoensis TaxID=53368 RepID=UPI0004024BC5|nr:hypothetical protein [Hamadaea tsunoensis]
MNYPVALALEDLVPTLLAFAAFFLLAGLSPTPFRVRAGRLGAICIVAGGLAKCLWKLLVSAASTDVPWLEAALFPLMALGALLLLWALFRWPWWPFAALALLVLGGALLSMSMQPVFVLATAAVTALSVAGAIYAARRGRWPAVALYAVGVLAVLGLVPLRHSASHSTLTFQWIEQSVNTVAQGALLLAAWLTVRAYRPSASEVIA